jgi:hypothetical protein
MKNTKIQFLIMVTICLLLLNCNQEPKRDLYPEVLVSGFELLSAEKTGIDFNNAIK